MSGPTFGAHPHFLGTWDPLSALELRDAGGVAWRPVRDDERVALVSATPTVAVLTLPSWLGHELERIEWSDGSAESKVVEQAQFAMYSERVVEFCRFAGIALSERCEARLVATTEREVRPLAVARAEGPAFVFLANVGDAPLRIALRAIDESTTTPRRSLLLPPGQACVVSREAAPYAVALAGDDEFGVHLEFDG